MKLVRSRLGEIDWPSYPETKAALRPVRDRAEHLGLLRSKLLEEVGELFRAPDDAGELADCLEVLRAWAALHGLAWTDVERTRYAKYENRGGYACGVVWDLG